MKAADFEKWSGRPFDLADLRTRSAARVADDMEFKFLLEDTQRMKERIAANTVSLNKAKREAEIAAEKKRTEDRKAMRLAVKRPEPVAYKLALEDIDKPALTLVKQDEAEKAKLRASNRRERDNSAEADDLLDDDAPGNDKVDPVKFESLSILADLIEQLRRPAIARVKE